MKNSIRKIIAVLAVIAVVFCSFAACSNSGSKTSTDETAADYIIVTDTEFKPFEYTDENGNLVGIDVDILAAVAEDQGFSYDIQSLGFKKAITACQEGKADGLIAGASITSGREDSGWIFSDSYYTATQCIAVKEGSEMKEVADIMGANAAVKANTLGETYAENMADQYDLTIYYYEDSESMYEAVEDGECDVCFEDTPAMKAQIADGTVALSVLEDSENDGSDYGFAVFNSDNKKLVDLFNAGLKNIKANGTYDQIIEKYLGK